MTTPPPSELLALTVPVGDPVRVLVAEDVEVNRELIRLVLEKQGYHVDEVQNGERALQAILANCYDIVLRDMHMPVMDGVEATRALRAMGGRFTDLPVIALSASAMTQEIERWLDAGMTAHLPKPFTSQTLCDTIARWTQRADRPQVVIAAMVHQAGWRPVQRLLQLLLGQIDVFSACNPNDRRQLQAEAHALRGSASLFGFKTLASASRTLEDCCRMSQPVDAAYATVKRLSGLVHKEIARNLDSHVDAGAAGPPTR